MSAVCYHPDCVTDNRAASIHGKRWPTLFWGDEDLTADEYLMQQDRRKEGRWARGALPLTGRDRSKEREPPLTKVTSLES